MAEKVTFQTNIVQELALKFPRGKEIESQFDPSGKQYMFSTIDDRVLFASPYLADKIHALNLAEAEPFEIGRMEKMDGRKKSITWHVAKVGFVPGEQPNGTFAVPAPPANVQAPAAAVTAAAPAHQPMKANGSNHNTSNGSAPLKPTPLEHTGWALYLGEQTNVLIDIYARSLKYAGEQYGNLVKPEDVRALLTTTFINISQKGGMR